MSFDYGWNEASFHSPFATNPFNKKNPYFESHIKILYSSII